MRLGDKGSAAIPSKAKYYELARKGQLGNTLKQWTYLNFIEEHLINLFEIKSVKTIFGLRCSIPTSSIQGTDLTVLEVVRRVELAIKQGVDPATVYVDECAPDHLITLQGEVMRDEHYLRLRYNTVPGMRMRQAYPTMQHARGLTALLLLQRHADPMSMDMFNDIWGRYPSAIIEFSSYRCPVGQLQWNTLFWEVRDGY